MTSVSLSYPLLWKIISMIDKTKEDSKCYIRYFMIALLTIIIFLIIFGLVTAKMTHEGDLIVKLYDTYCQNKLKKIKEN